MSVKNWIDRLCELDDKHRAGTLTDAERKERDFWNHVPEPTEGLKALVREYWQYTHPRRPREMTSDDIGVTP